MSQAAVMFPRVTTLEMRVERLEKQVADLLELINEPPKKASKKAPKKVPE